MLELRSPYGELARVAMCALAIALLGLCAGVARAEPVTYADQGWSKDDRNEFYTTGQGSRLMLYAWFKALRRLDVDEAFAADHLQRYGYLPNDNPNNATGLPIGFVVEKKSGQLGMTCAACHTGQLEYVKPDGKTLTLRLDGAPASAHFQQ